MDDQRAPIQMALCALAAQGFHRLDREFGRELTESEQLDLPQMVVAARLLRRYRPQLEHLELILPEEAILIQWAIEQDEVISKEEHTMLLELSSQPEPALVAEQPESPPETTDQSEKPPVAKRVFLQDDRIFVEFPFDRSKVNAIQPLKEIIEDWAFNRFKRQEWSFPQEAALRVYEITRTFHQGFTYSKEATTLIKRQHRQETLVAAARELEQRWHELSQYAALEAAQPYLDGAPTANGQRLFRHQREAVQRMIEAERFILAHQMGTGKTKSSLIAAWAYDLPIWVVAPAGTLINWQREAVAAGVEITLYSWAKLPDPPEHLNYVLIADEAHYAQGSEETVRGKGFLRLADRARAVLMLSGTPIKNSLPINLWPLLVAAKHPLAANRSAYERLYCGGHYRSIGRKRSVYDTSGASNLDELHERTRDVILYKKKSECIDLPEKLRMSRQAEVSDAGELAYRKTILRLRQEHLERMANKYEALRAGREELLGEGIKESDLGEFESAYVSALVELGIYHHASSLAKVESAAEIAQEAVEQAQSVLLFCAFRDTAERLATKLGADCLTGEVTGKRRQDMIDRFQAEETKTLVATIGAGGIGINLTAAQIVVMVDRGWTPTDVEQAEDRAHRLGTRHNVTSIWLQYGAVDDKIDQLLQIKQERIETILRGRGKGLRGVPGIRALAREIMESVHTGKSLAEILGLDSGEFEHPAVDLVRDPSGAVPQPGEKKDGRLKGRVKRIRKNVMLDEEIATFLETMKVPNQKTSTESGYSGFLETLVRGTDQFAAWRASRRLPQEPTDA
jgi:SNF2 family DNA or RNA helicase